MRSLKIDKYIENLKSLIILGPRGSGKSYFLKKEVLPKIQSNLKNFEIMFIDLLDSASYRKYLQSPEILNLEIKEKINSFPPSVDKLLVIIDEIQKIPMLMNEVHMLIENFKSQIMFIMTGSSARKLKSSGINLLAGRAYYKNFYPFCLEEIGKNFNVDFETKQNQVLQYGLLPESYCEKNDEFKIEYLMNYTNVYLHEEIMQEGLVRGLNAFSKFLELVAQYNGVIVDYTSFSKKIGVAAGTIKEYYEILEDTLVAYKIPAWEKSVKKQLQKSARYYLFDNGVLNSLTGDLKSELKSSSYRYGKLFENFVITEIIKANSLFDLDLKLFHYRTNTGKEIDLIIEKKTNQSKKLFAVEIKSSEVELLVDEKFKELKNFKDEFVDAKLVVVCNAIHSITKNDISFMPLRDFLLLLNKNENENN